jgi:phage/plasmid-associated DNA primase
MVQRQGYSDDFQRRFEAEQDARRQEQEERTARNARLQAEHRQRLEDARVAERVTHEERIVATFETQKQHAKRQWLYDHPDKTADNFEHHAWPLLRENWLLEADPGILGWREREAKRQAQKVYGPRTPAEQAEHQAIADRYLAQARGETLP